MIEDSYIIDRLRLKKRARRWRFLALFLIAIFFFTFVFQKKDGWETEQNHIVSLELNGTLTQNRDILKSLDKIAGDDNIRAVVVNINSPGGTAVGGESLYNAFLEISKKKPIVASIGELGTSAAYLAALGTDRIFAYESSLTGSIGVVLPNFEVSDLAKKYGVTFDFFKSSPFKGIPNNFEKLDDSQKKYVQSLIDDSHKFFVQKVKQRRKFSDKDVNAVADGRVFVGFKAYDLKLIDQLGDENDAIKWLKNNNEELKNLKVKNIDVVKPIGKFQKLLDYSSNALILCTNFLNQIEASDIKNKGGLLS